MGDEINRKDIDDIGCRNNDTNSYKNRYFDGKRTAQDEYTGQKLYYSKKEKFTADTTANTDHIVPINKLIYKYGESLSKEELRNIANSDNNLAITAESLNKSKGHLENHEYLLRQLSEGNPENALTTYNMLKAEVQAKVSINSNILASKTVNSVGALANTDIAKL